jgi:hypothetical protein
MGDLTNQQICGVVLGGALGFVVNYLSEIYVEPNTSNDPLTWLVNDISVINQDFQASRFTNPLYTYFKMSGWDFVQATIPWLMMWAKPTSVGSAFAIAWSTQYVLEPWAQPRMSPLLNNY